MVFWLFLDQPNILTTFKILQVKKALANQRTWKHVPCDVNMEIQGELAVLTIGR